MLTQWACNICSVTKLLLNWYYNYCIQIHIHNQVAILKGNQTLVSLHYFVFLWHWLLIFAHVISFVSNKNNENFLVSILRMDPIQSLCNSLNSLSLSPTKGALIKQITAAKDTPSGVERLHQNHKDANR